MAFDKRYEVYNVAHPVDTSNIAKRNSEILQRITGCECADIGIATNCNVYTAAIYASGGAGIAQLKYLGLFPHTANEQIYRGRQLSKSGYMGISGGESVGYANGLATAYPVTSKTEKYFKSIEEPLGIGEYNMMVVDRPMQLNSRTIAHSIASNDIRYFLYGYRGFPIVNTYTREYAVLSDGTDAGYQFGDKILASDAYYGYVVDGSYYQNYVEADSGQQRLPVLVDKFKAYEKYVLRRADNIGALSIQFSIFQADDMYMTVKANEEGSSILSLAQLGHIHALMLLHHCTNIRELVAKLSSIAQSTEDVFSKAGCLVSQLPSIMQTLNTLVSRNCLTEKDAYALCMDGGAGGSRQAIAIKDKLDKHYYTRRKLLFDNILKEVPELKEHILKGLVFTALPNHDLYGVYPFVYPHPCGLDEALSLQLGTIGIHSLAYKGCQPLLLGKNGELVYHFRNVYESSDGVVAVENVDADIGGATRVRNFYSLPQNLSAKLRIVCLVKDEATALSFASTLDYGSSYVSVCTHKGITNPLPIREVVKRKASCMILFITYDALWQTKLSGIVSDGPFVISDSTHINYLKEDFEHEKIC